MGLTDDQFRNVLAFVILMNGENARSVLGISPDYMVEKFSRYVAHPTNSVPFDRNLSDWGLHPGLREVFDEYIEKWCTK